MMDPCRLAEIKGDWIDQKEEAIDFGKENRIRVGQIWRANREQADREGRWLQRSTSTLELLAKIFKQWASTEHPPCHAI